MSILEMILLLKGKISFDIGPITKLWAGGENALRGSVSSGLSATDDLWKADSASRRDWPRE